MLGRKGHILPQAIESAGNAPLIVSHPVVSDPCSPHTWGMIRLIMGIYYPAANDIGSEEK